MQQVIKLKGVEVPYQLVKSRRGRTVRLSVRPGGLVKVMAPASLDPARIEQFMVEKSEWIVAKYNELKKYPARNPDAARAEFNRHKRAALELVTKKIIEFGRVYNLQPNKISVKNHQSLWGSCSRRGNLNFNYRIVMLPEALCDYVVVHELCHLQEFNHSDRFWKLVAQTVPDHVRRRAELKKWGLSLG